MRMGGLGFSWGWGWGWGWGLGVGVGTLATVGGGVAPILATGFEALGRWTLCTSLTKILVRRFFSRSVAKDAIARSYRKN